MMQLRSLLLLVVLALGWPLFFPRACSEPIHVGTDAPPEVTVGVVFWVTVDPANGLALSLSGMPVNGGPGRRMIPIRFEEKRDEGTGTTRELAALNAEGEVLAEAEILAAGTRVRVHSGAGVEARLEAVGFREVYVEQRGGAWTRIFLGPRGDLAPGIPARER